MPDAESASDIAYRQIRDAILTGAYAEGSMLGEVSLANEIGVSRTPVRTALALLQDEGWVTRYPKRGALVRGLTERAISDLVDARFILESTGVQRGRPGMRSQLASRLAGHVNDQQQALDGSDVRAFIESTIAFHRSFVEVGDNEVMLELYDRLADRQRYLLFKLGARLLERCDAIIAEHRELVDRLADDDPASFTETLRRHLSDTNELPVQPFGGVSLD